MYALAVSTVYVLAYRREWTPDFRQHLHFGVLEYIAVPHADRWRVVLMGCFFLLDKAA